MHGLRQLLSLRCVVELARGYAMRLKVATAVLALALLGLIAFTVYDRWPQGEDVPAYHSPSPTAGPVISCDYGVLCGLWRATRDMTNPDLKRMLRACGIQSADAHKVIIICNPPKPITVP